MSILRFRVTFEDYDDIHRDIDLKSDQHFGDLFNVLLSSVGFDSKHSGVFHLADHHWRKGKMIGELNGEKDNKLSKTELIDHIDDPHQKFLFTYDENAKWNFNIELIRIIPSPQSGIHYPNISASVGEAPVQYKETLIIPSRDNQETETRGRKSKSRAYDEDGIPILPVMGLDKEESTPDKEINETSPEELSLDLPEDLELETDNEIARLAEEFNHTTDVSDESISDDEEESGFGFDDEEDSGQNDEEDYGGGYGSKNDYDDY